MIGRNYRKINYPMLCKVMGWLLMIESLFMVFPCLISLYYSEYDWRGFAVSAGLTFLAGISLNYFSRPKVKTLGKREGFLLTALVWVVFSFFGMLPFIICSSPYTWCEAFMEAMAGFTTTGCVVIPDVEILTHGEQMWRALMQWLGGMGIVIFTLAVIPMLNHSGGMQMYNAEVTGITHEKLSPRISQTAKMLWLIYFILTCLCMLFLCMGPVRLFDGVVQSLGTIATGGFSPYNDGINHYNSDYVKVVLTVFMFLGGVNFTLVYGAAHGNFSNISRNEPLKWFALGALCFAILCFASNMIRGIYANGAEAAVNSAFQTVAVMTTTGYAVSGVGAWGGALLLLMILLMWIGGCAGSTSGGVKTDRIIVLFRFMRNELRRALQPNSVPSVKLSGRMISTELASKTVAFLCLDVFVVFASAALLAGMDVPLADAVFSSVSCISNSGICLGIGEYGGSLAPIPEAGKILLSLVMLTGRLEIFTILVLFTRGFWHK